MLDVLLFCAGLAVAAVDVTEIGTALLQLLFIC
jgi:hypothetical protein